MAMNLDKIVISTFFDELEKIGASKFVKVLTYKIPIGKHHYIPAVPTAVSIGAIIGAHKLLAKKTKYKDPTGEITKSLLSLKLLERVV
jgi:hypothetical protein